MIIGIIGHGFVGKAYADYYQSAGYTVIRYSLEEPHRGNRELICQCDIVLIAVPTPTTDTGPDYSVVESVLSLVGNGKIAVIKSTVDPGFTEDASRAYPHLTILHSPEFLREKTAAEDVLKPDRIVVGLPQFDDRHIKAANKYVETLPNCIRNILCDSKASELAKYVGNFFLTAKVVYANIVYELSNKLGVDYDEVRKIVGSDLRIGDSHLNVKQDGGRGAGGHCFIKDAEAFKKVFENFTCDEPTLKFINAVIDKNIYLLVYSGKDIEILKQVYPK